MQVRGLGERLDHLEPPAVLQRGDARACRCGRRRIDLREDDAWLGAAFGEHAAPRIDDQRVAEGLTSVLVLSALCRRKNKTAVLDGARASEHVPMRLAGLCGEGGGD